MNENGIKEILMNGECVTLECKRAKTEVPKSVWETYSAFANTEGGVILLGIEEDKKEKDIEKHFKIIGVDDAQKIINDFWNTINSDKVNENILVSSDIDTVKINDVQIVYIHVPQADWRIKPIYLNGNVYKGTYRRNHEGDYHCTERQVRSMIRDSFDDGNDGMLLEHYDMNDIDMDTLHRYRTLFQYRNDGHVWNEVDDKIFLKNLGGYIIDRVTNKEGLTMAGLMMFGKGLSVQERFANFRMDYIDFCNLIGDERYRDRLTYDGRWENNLYQFFSRVIPKVTADLPRPFRMEGIQRVDDTPQHKAVREAFINAIIHSDLLLDAGILRIEKHDDRLCFRNPGLLKLPIEMIYEGGNSKARNPRIQNMLRMIGYGENVGSGFPQIIAAWKDTNWGEPQLLNRLDIDEVELILPIPSPKGVLKSVPINIAIKISDVLKDVLKDVHKDILKELTDRQIVILETIYTTPNVTQQELSIKLKVSQKTIQREFSAIRKLGINIYRQDGRKEGEWVIKV
ncbi:MAG: putative DNA binding domain-containing protein [Bacteroidales bacterium]|nr:putative DNA binding domain-containing protein [Bacteroidales bacterium]